MAVVGVGLWLGSGQQPIPIAAAPESAVVVSSLTCTDGAGGTVVDVLEPMGAPGSGPLRANLDACGYREGQRLQVQFVPDDRTQVVLAGNESATDFLTGDRLPVGLAMAGLLALGAVVAVVVDGRRRRAGSLWRTLRDGQWRNIFRNSAEQQTGLWRGGSGDGGGARRAAAHQAIDPDEAIDPDLMSDPDGWPADLQLAGFHTSNASVFGNTMVLPLARPRQGRHARPVADPADAAPEPADAAREPVGAAPEQVNTERPGESQRGLTSVDLTFPFSSTLAACLHDELFTHRSASS